MEPSGVGIISGRCSVHILPDDCILQIPIVDPNLNLTS